MSGAGKAAGEGPESTDEYPPGTERYSAPPRDAGSLDASEAPHWKRAGFASFQDYMDYLRRQQRIYDPTPLRGTQVPAAELPTTPEPRRPGPLLRDRQVNVKLRAHEHDELGRVAQLYGVPPATLARLLVVRGVRAVLDREP